MFSDPLQTIFLLILSAVLPCLLFMRKALATPPRDRALVAVLLFVVSSTTAFLAGVYLGGILLIAGFWMAIGGGTQVSNLLIVCALVIIFALILFDSIALAGLSHFSGMAFQSKRSLSLVGTVVVLCQVGCLLVMQKVGPLGYMPPKPLFGYIDKSGQFVIKPAFAEAEKFRSGKAVVWPEGAKPAFVGGVQALPTYNLIDKSGCVVGQISEKEHLAIREKFKYDNPEDYFESKTGESSFGILARESGWQLFRGMGSDIATQVFEGLAYRAEPYGQGAYIDKGGRFVNACRYEDGQRFSEGVAAVKQGSVWGYIDKSGNYVVAPRFALASPFHEGLACVALWNDNKVDKYRELDCDNLRFGYIDKTGKFVIPPVFMHAYSFSQGLAAARIDVNDPPQFQQASQRLVELDKQEASRSKLNEKKVLDGLRVNSALCVLSWRDGAAWSKTAKDGPGWLLEVNRLLAYHQEDDELIAIKAAIYSALYPPNLGQAEDAARQAVTANSKNALALGVLGHCLSLRRAYKQAIVEFDKALICQPRNIEWLAARGLCHEDMNENTLAVKDYTAMISLAPRMAWPYGSRAHAYLALNEVDKAIGDVNAVLRIEPKNVYALKQLADAYVHKKQLDKALGALLKAEQDIDPLSWEMDELLAMRAIVLEYKGDKAELAKVRKQIEALRKKLKS